MIALSLQELDQFARKIGVSVSRFHRSKYEKIPHYDLRAQDRKKALVLEAVEIS